MIDLDNSSCQISYSGGQFTIDTGKEDFPVITVTWYGADAYAKYYNKRLPTEAEWEKAARGVDERKYPWGNENPTSGHSNFANNIGATTPVGQYSPTGDSPYGCIDMAGNVWEWCNDWYGSNYYSSSPSQNPTGPEGSEKVLRGGSWGNDNNGITSTVRSNRLPTMSEGESNHSLGFRTVRDTDSPVTITGIELSPTSSMLKSTETQQFNCTAYFSDGKAVDVTKFAAWVTDPKTAGTITDSGLFIADATNTGDETVTVDYHGLQKQSTITVSSNFETGTVEDFDGNIYKTIKIGDQWWMAQNLKVKHYQNGELIPNETDYSTWAGLTTGARCAYGNLESNANTYGYLYNWYAVDDNRNIAPKGWHVPTDEDWKILEMALGMNQSEADDTGYRGTNEGSKLAGNASLWQSGDLENNDAFGESGFSALPGGSRDYPGYYYAIGYYAVFWSSSEHDISHAWGRHPHYSTSEVYRGTSNKRNGFSVRCLRDN